MSDDVKRYYGIMIYGATGEGHREIAYIDWGTDPEDFKKRMIEECGIDEYFAIGIEVYDEIDENTPEIVFRYWRSLQRCEGHLKFEYYVNCS